MNFRTEISPAKGLTGSISHSTPLLLIGSCFAESVGARLDNAWFDVTVNPFGPLYNPASIYEALAAYEVEGELFVDGEGRSHHYMAHSRLSRYSRSETEAEIAAAISETRRALTRVSTVIVTLGTTRYFRLRSNGKIVANCHKQPAAAFDECSMSSEETVEYLEKIMALVEREAPAGVKVIFTVSPVRYLGDGAHVNQISKATLMLAVEHVVARHANAGYFPAYEIMMDDLRDYRFYAEDMKHPSSQAVDYIYSIFSDTYFSAETLETAREAMKVTRRLAHRSDNPSQAPSIIAARLIESFPCLTHVYNRKFNQ